MFNKINSNYNTRKSYIIICKFIEKYITSVKIDSKSARLKNMKSQFNKSHSSLEAPSSVKRGNIAPSFRLQDKQDSKNAEMSNSTLAEMVMNVCHLLTVRDHQGSKLWLKKLVS